MSEHIMEKLTIRPLNDVSEKLSKHANEHEVRTGTLSALTERCNRLEVENAKLREQGARLFDKTLELGTENDRLRELANDMFTCISHANEQDWFYFERDEAGCGLSCTVNGEGCGLSVLAERMRELRIEVD